MNKVVYFPVCLFLNGRYCHGGRKFKTKKDWHNALTDLDRKRTLDWIDRHEDWLRLEWHERVKQWGAA
jgi:hypothetical protein